MEKWGKVLPSKSFSCLLPSSQLVMMSNTRAALIICCSGTFGQVLECWDVERKEMVAIKVIRGIKKYREAAMIEVDVLQQLGKHDKGGSR